MRLFLLALLGCSYAPLDKLPSDAAGGKTDAEYRSEILTSLHDSIGVDLANLVQAAHDLQMAAPSHAWNATNDAVAITAMHDAWRAARLAYEHVEGVIAPIFINLDIAVDARYEAYLNNLVPNGDSNPFDGQGVIGMHGIERILFAPMIRPEVSGFESALPGYKAAAFPANDAEAMSFKVSLVQKLIDDATSLHDQWQTAALDIGVTYRDLVNTMRQPGEKVDLAPVGEEESRYANTTLLDLRSNLDGAKQTYGVFRAWIQSKPTGADLDAMVQARFTALTTLYDSLPGDALPTVPSGWSSEHPTTNDLATPFGSLWKTVREDGDPTTTGSVVSRMNAIAAALGFP